jgi:hypothetical protein
MASMTTAPSHSRITSSYSPDMSIMSQAKHCAKAKGRGVKEPGGKQRNSTKLFIFFN